MAKQEIVRVKLLRGVRIAGEGFAAGHVLEVEESLATMLVGYGKAMKTDAPLGPPTAPKQETKQEFKK